MKFEEFERKCASIIDHVLFWLQRLWYVALLTASSIVVGYNFDDCIDMRFFDDFDGMNLIFIVWLLLLISPLIGKFEAFGVNVEMKQEGDRITDKYDKLFAEQERKEKGGTK